MQRWRRALVVVGLLAVVIAPLVWFGISFRAMNDFVKHPSTTVSSTVATDIRRGLKFDFAYIPLYALVTALTCWLPTRSLVRYQAVGRRLAWLAVMAAAADVLENAESFDALNGHDSALPWVRYATAAKWGLLVVPAVFGVCAVIAWATGKAVHPTPSRGEVADALAWAATQKPLAPAPRRARVECWLRGDRPAPPTAPPPARAAPAAGTGVCFSGGGIRSAAYNLGVLQELQACGELGRADMLASVSGGSYIAGAHAITSACSDADALGTVPPFAPGSVEEQYLRNRTTYLFPGLGGTGYALWRLVRGLAVNVGFIGVVLFILARPYGWFVEPNLNFPCPEIQGVATTTTRPAPAAPSATIACPPRPEGTADRATRRDVTFESFGWSGRLLGGIAALALVAGLIDMVVRPKEKAAGRLETWSFRLVGVAVLLGVLLYLLPWLAARLFSDVTYKNSALDRLPAGTAIAGAFSSLGTMVLVALRSGPKSGAGGTSSGLDIGGIAGKVKSGAAKLGDGMLQLLMVIVGGVIGPVALGGAFLALAMGSMVRPGLVSSQFGFWLLAISILVLVQGVGDANRWSLQPYYKRRLQTAFALRRRCEPGRGAVAEEVPFDVPISLTGLLDAPHLVLCAAVNLTSYGLLPPGRGVCTFTFSRDTVDAGILGSVPTPILATLLGPHYARDFTVPAAMAASGAAASPVMGKMTKPAFRFLFALTNVRLGVWLPNPSRVTEWARAQRLSPPPPAPPTAELQAARAAVAHAEAAEEVARRAAAKVELPDVEQTAQVQAVLQAARLETERRRRTVRELEIVAWPPDADFLGYPWLPRPTLIFRELFGYFRSTSRFVYVTDGGHYDNLGLVELIRRGCRQIYSFDAAGDKVDRFSTVADAVAIARTELGVRIELDPTPMAPPAGSKFNAKDCVAGTFHYPGEPTPGRIVFAKLGVVEGVPADVRSWKEYHPNFPTDGTADQLYTDERFEAYRALGSGTAVRAIAMMRGLRDGVSFAEPAPLRRGSTNCPP